MADPFDNPDPGAIDPEALRRAEAVVEQLRWTYIREWAPAAMKEIEAEVQAIDRAARAEANGSAHCEIIARLTHDMKGQAGTFGLQLLHDFAESLHGLARQVETVGPREAAVFQAHATAMRSVLSDISSSPEAELDTALERELRDGLRKLARLHFN